MQSVWEKFEPYFEAEMRKRATSDDPAHDFLHFKRVVKIAKKLCLEEKAEMNVVVPAAWLHDFVNLPKSDPRRSEASRMAADEAILFLKGLGYPEVYFSRIHHAIVAHSFSAAVKPETVEAQTVQDADRLDGLGAIGIARCFAVAGLLKRPFFDDEDPFCANRTPEDSKFTIDHFFVKLLKLHESLGTKSGREEGLRRTEIMRRFLEDLEDEVVLSIYRV